jgi:hypothetical protein
VLTEKWGIVPFEPLARVIRESIGSRAAPPDFVDMSGVEDLEAAGKELEKDAAERPGELIKDVIVDDLGRDAGLVKYDVATRRIVVNRNHPFAEEHGETSEQLRLLRDAALVDLLTDAFMADLGIPGDQLKEIRDYKDRAFRLVAQVRRRSAAQIASLLLDLTNNEKAFERILGDALEHIGFSVERLGEPGQPEGVATAVVTPASNDTHVAYKFTYDAKSSSRGKSKTSNVGIAGLARHRKDHGADHTLVVAPGFEAGALEKECEQSEVTPMLAGDLAKLVMLSVGYGPLNLIEFRNVFKLFSPTSVTDWVSGLVAKLKNAKQLSLGVLIQVLTTLAEKNPDRPDMIHCSLVAEQYRSSTGDPKYPTRNDVATTIRGLALMVPNVISISPTQEIFLNAPPAKIRDAVMKQLNAVPDALRYGIIRGDGA